MDAGTNGTLYFDDFESRRFSYIGTLTDPGVDDPSATDQAGWFTRTYAYSAAIPHAVTNVTPETGSPDTYEYDANGNMTCRVEGGVTYTHTYNAENRASSIAKRSGDCATGTILESWSFVYDGDGVRVGTVHFTGTQGTPDSTTSYYMGGQFEVKDGATKKYYSIAGMTVAMHDGSAVQYLLTDHLGSTVAVTNASGTLTSQQRYLPFGGVRSIPNSPILATDFGYTGQRLLDAGMGGIMDYRARFYSPALGKFFQPDLVIPNMANPQDLNRSCYVGNNPLLYADPSGHAPLRRGASLGSVGSGGKSGGCNDRRDLTKWMSAAAVYMATDPEMQKVKKLNSGGIISKIVGAAKFYTLVRNKARFDVKHLMWRDLGPDVKIGDYWYEHSTPGNILYGFYGSEAGYSSAWLHIGAGVAQGMDVARWGFNKAANREFNEDFPGLGAWSTAFDTTDDAQAIDLGIELYENSFANDRNLTEEEFIGGSDDISEIWGLNRVKDPGNCLPNTTGPYEPNRFDYPQ